jgi:hypothetical protein
VTLTESATNTVVRVPWQPGLTLAGAGDAAKLRLAQRAVDVVRGGKIVYAAAKVTGDGAVLAPGDVVRVAGPAP